MNIIRTPWFDRKFTRIEDNSLLLGIIERLEGTPVRMQNKLINCSDNYLSSTKKNKWSLKKEVGHLGDLEILWLTRVKEIKNGAQDLSAADLKNTKTNLATHDDRKILDLINDFSKQRRLLILELKNLASGDLSKESKHPRLGTPMKIVDLAYFVAEHDDHHLATMTRLLTCLD